MGIINFTTFVVTSFLFILSPGIDTIFILNKSITQGKKWGLYSTLGITTGVLIHTIFAAFGLSLILAQSATAFNIVKYLGAAYLVYLGITKLFVREGIIKKESQPQTLSVKKTYFSAVFTNTLNPKVAIFFLAFFPQFIQPAYLHNALPFIALGITYGFIGLLWFTVLTLFAGAFSNKLQSTPSIILWLNKCSGAVFILMGAKVALTKR